MQHHPEVALRDAQQFANLLALNAIHLAHGKDRGHFFGQFAGAIAIGLPEQLIIQTLALTMPFLGTQFMNPTALAQTVAAVPGLAEPDPDLLASFRSVPVLIARLEPLGPPPAGPQLGFAGVGKPWKVERALVEAGCELVDFIPLPDHAAYDVGLLKQLSGQASAAGAGLITTEKDWARLPPDWRERVTAWPVRARFEDEAGLDQLLARAISK